MSKQDKYVIRRGDLVRYVAKKCDQYHKDVAVMQDALQDYLEELIVTAPKDKPTVIKIFDGISIVLEPKEAERRYLPLYKEERDIPERLRISADVTEHYKIKINKMRNDI